MSFLRDDLLDDDDDTVSMDTKFKVHFLDPSYENINHQEFMFCTRLIKAKSSKELANNYIHQYQVWPSSCSIYKLIQGCTSPTLSNTRIYMKYTLRRRCWKVVLLVIITLISHTCIVISIMDVNPQSIVEIGSCCKQPRTQRGSLASIYLRNSILVIVYTC